MDKMKIFAKNEKELKFQIEMIRILSKMNGI